MEKHFCNYNQSLALNELGYDENCLAFYQKEYTEETPVMIDDDYQYRLTGWRTCRNSEIPKHYTSAPLKSQVFDWARKYKLSVVIHDLRDDYEANIIEWTLDDDKISYGFLQPFETYEEAESACIDKLIEIVKNNLDK